MMVVILHNQKIGGLFLAYMFVLKAAELFIDNFFLDLAQCDIVLSDWTYISIYVHICSYTNMKSSFRFGFFKKQGARGYGARSGASLSSVASCRRFELAFSSYSNLCVCRLLRSLFSSDFCPITKRGHTIQLLPWTLLGSS